MNLTMLAETGSRPEFGKGKETRNEKWSSDLGQTGNDPLALESENNRSRFDSLMASTYTIVLLCL